MPSTRQRVVNLTSSGALPPERLEDALRLVGVLPDDRAWRDFIDDGLMWLGGLALAVSVVFFFAWNWDDLGRFAKFALVQALIVAAVVGYWRLGVDKTSGKISLFVAAVFVGVLFALYGQTYQTGVDPWQLFFNWALMILPWAAVGRFSALWLLVVVLLNVATLTYTHTFGGLFGLVFQSDTDAVWLVFGVNLAALGVWEYFGRSVNWLAERWPLRLLAVASGTAMTWLALEAIISKEVLMPVVVWMAWLAGVYAFYRYVSRDLFMLAGGCLSAIVVIVTWLARSLLDSDVDEAVFLLLSVVTIALGAGAAVFLRRVQRSWHL